MRSLRAVALITHFIGFVVAPKKFVLFADSNTINLISLDGHLHNQRVQRVIIGDVGASYVALTLDHIRNIFYFSDITRYEHNH